MIRASHSGGYARSASRYVFIRCVCISYQEIDAFEVNEAFAVIDVLFERAFPGIEDRYNIWGGALAYGHPYEVSGAMILLHLMKALEHKNGHLGMCCVAAAGGIGSSILVEKVMK